jgi:SNF2 family DNA or RNA helicase
MGLGKTIMVIALILAHRPSYLDKTLVIVPLSVAKQWEQQLNKFAPFLSVLVVN